MPHLRLVLLALALTSCQAAPVGVGAASTGVVAIHLDALLPARQLRGLSFAEPAIQQVKLEAAGPGMATTASATATWNPAAPTTVPALLTLAVPAGKNRLFTLTGLDGDGHALAVMRTLASVAAGATATVDLDADTDAAARVLAALLAGPGPLDTADTSGVGASLAVTDLTASLRSFVSGATGYDPTDNTYGLIVPRRLKAGAIANQLRGATTPATVLTAAITGAAAVPAGLTLTVTVHNGVTPVAGAAVQLFDPASPTQTTDVNGEATFTQVPPGTWTLRAEQNTAVAWGSFDAAEAATTGAVDLTF